MARAIRSAFNGGGGGLPVANPESPPDITPGGASVAPPKPENEYEQWQRETFGHVVKRVAEPIARRAAAPVAEPAQAAASPSVIRSVLVSIREPFTTAKAEPERAEAVLVEALEESQYTFEPTPIDVIAEPVAQQLTRVEPAPVAEPAPPPPVQKRNMAPNRMAAHVAALPQPQHGRVMAPNRMAADPPPPLTVGQPVADSALLRRMAALLASAHPAATLALPSPLEQPCPDFAPRKERAHVK